MGGERGRNAGCGARGEGARVRSRQAGGTDSETVRRAGGSSGVGDPGPAGLLAEPRPSQHGGAGSPRRGGSWEL